MPNASVVPIADARCPINVLAEKGNYFAEQISSGKSLSFALFLINLKRTQKILNLNKKWAARVLL